MKLPGYLDPSFVPPAPSIYAQIESGVLQGRGTVAFLVDTGASVTTIMDRDRDRLGIDWDRLDKTKRPLSGIGGTVDTRIIRDGILLFKTDTGAQSERDSGFTLRNTIPREWTVMEENLSCSFPR